VRSVEPVSSSLRFDPPAERHRAGDADLTETPLIPDNAEREADSPSAAIPARLLAAILDLALLVAIDLVVVVLTLKLTGLPSAESSRLPLAPMGGFLAILNFGYAVLMTVMGGQTIGKMATGIRVVHVHRDDVPLGAGLVRALGLLVGALPAGLGFAAILIDRDRRALHDRLAGTKVVKVL